MLDLPDNIRDTFAWGRPGGDPIAFIAFICFLCNCLTSVSQQQPCATNLFLRHMFGQVGGTPDPLPFQKAPIEETEGRMVFLTVLSTLNVIRLDAQKREITPRQDQN